MLDALDLHDWLVGRCFQHEVVTATTRMFRVYRATERLAPEVGGFVDTGRLAVD
jgi:hypothetical protein